MNYIRIPGLLEEARHRITLALEDIREGENQSSDSSVPLVPTPRPMLASLIVGKAEGSPGETVSVEILGGTSIPVTSFAIAIGCNSMLSLVGVEESPHLKTILGIDDVEDINRQHRRGNNWQDNWIQLYVGFYGQVWGVVEVEDGEPIPRPKRTIVEALIPTMTPLYVLKLKIPGDATAGMRFPLDCEQRYGHRLSSNGPIKFIEYPPLFGTTREASQFGITKDKIDLVSGWIDVV